MYRKILLTLFFAAATVSAAQSAPAESSPTESSPARIYTVYNISAPVVNDMIERYMEQKPAPADDDPLRIYMRHVKHGNHLAAKRQLQIAAKQNIPPAMLLIAMQYMLSPLEDHNKIGVMYLERAAKLGSYEANTVLGKMYVDGYLVPKDLDKGLAMLNKALSRPNGDIYYALGRLHATELPDAEKATFYLRMAMEYMNGNASAELARLYMEGKLVPKDPDLARVFLKKALSTDSKRAYYVNALALETGALGIKEPAEAERFMRMAAAKGIPEAVEEMKRRHKSSLETED